MATEFDTREYRFSHGREPRGRGAWAFEVNGHTVWAQKNGIMSMTYTEAKKAIRAQFPGVRTFKVLP